MLNTIITTLRNNIKNIPGKSTKRKIVVIECDDWGGIRMPSKEVYDELLSQGIPVDRNRFNKFDTLEDKSDLEQLYDVLTSVKDKNGNPAVMTPVTNIANPNFKKIMQSDFTEYFNEPFTETLKKYKRDPQTFQVWKEGIKRGIFVPESHGREHLSVQIWLQKLRQNNPLLIKAFLLGLTSVPLSDINPAVREFRPEFYFDDDSQIPFLKESIKNGIEMFTNVFGFLPKVFVPSNGIFHPVFEKAVAEAGIKFLYVSHSMPQPDGSGNLKKKRFRVNKITKEGLTYYTRNCVFEPTDYKYKGINYTLKQIEAAFRWHKPANISTHRVNFVGGIDESNREKGLTELSKLLKQVVRKWPDVEFMNTGKMFEIIWNKDYLGNY